MCATAISTGARPALMFAGWFFKCILLAPKPGFLIAPAQGLSVHKSDKNLGACSHTLILGLKNPSLSSTLCVLVEAVAKRRDNLKQKEVIHAAVLKINFSWVVLRKLKQGCCQKIKKKKKGEMKSVPLTGC